MALCPSRHRATLLASLLALGALGCEDEDPLCFEGEFRGCSCGEQSGYQGCAQGVYGQCVCDGTTPGLPTGAGGSAGGGAAGGGGAGGAPKIPFCSPCEEDIECETGLCYPFNAKGKHCTHPCRGDGDCEPPSPGCNMMGVCKIP
jgi:hypothetical protein